MLGATSPSTRPIWSWSSSLGIRSSRWWGKKKIAMRNAFQVGLQRFVHKFTDAKIDASSSRVVVLVNMAVGGSKKTKIEL